MPLSFFQIDPDTTGPYFQQWNFTVQKLIAGVLSVEGAWVGAKGTRIEFSRPVNVPLPGPGNIQDRRPWPRFASGSFVENSAYSAYNAFQMKVEMRAWRGLSWLGSYAFGKSVDNLSSDVQGFASQDPNNNNAEKGPYRRGFKNWDFITVRNFPIRERLRLQFRGEFFNFTNTPAFGAPVSNVQAANAGQILSAGEPPSIQLALKLIW